MWCEYSLSAVCLCPVDDRPDFYRVTVRSSRTIKVEDILAAVEAEAKKKQFQEEFTEKLSRTLATEVETVGHHSGVRTAIVCGEDLL